ncbi:hypothetical protein OOK36_51650 [Streptomyces sp. NBC_00365]|nr:hypothetical protein [Streptomyces sp. NBC_00365]MCX5097014.1 hypothetical protein [Streptomyces sp. NBC_00365]
MSCGLDVLGSVHVRMIGVAASGVLAPEDRLALAVSFGDEPAGVAALRGERGVDLHYARARVPGRVGEVVEDGPVQAPFLGDVHAGLGDRPGRRHGHVPRLEVFEDDQGVLLHEVCGGAGAEVCTPVCDAAHDPAGVERLAPVGAALLLPGKAILQAPVPDGFAGRDERPVDELAVRK